MKQYLLISSVYLAVFYLLYILLISKDTRYRRNRLYLLGSVILSLLLPYVKISTVSGGLLASINESMNTINIPQVNIYANDPGTEQSSILSIPLTIYLTGCLVAFVIFMANIFKLIVYIRKYKVEGSKIVLTPPGKESGFSAMGYIFLSSELEEEIKKTILYHEQQHIQNKHFLDIILLRLIGIFFWFNPFIYLYERSLKALHEFEADQQMLESGRNVVSYQRLIMNQIFNTNIFTLQNGFSGCSLIKKRMTMMTKRRSKKMSGLKLLLAVPFLLFVFGYFSCTRDEIDPLDQINETEDPVWLLDQTDQEAVSDEKPKSNVQYSDPKYVDDQIFVVVEDMPTFRGGDVNKFREWVQSNVTYPRIAAENGIQGKVFVMFVVDEKGQVTKAEILKGVDPSLDDEVLRVVNSSPSWSAGLQRGIPVKVRFSITVNFQLQ
ncbi:MAG: M56 family metallopeptidase [Bacteroidota bacterium]|nr:M56 family metallopeptidase [Bacteroidota bacterium]